MVNLKARYDEIKDEIEHGLAETIGTEAQMVNFQSEPTYDPLRGSISRDFLTAVYTKIFTHPL